MITVTLLAFLLILILGLATYTRVETSIAGNTLRQAQARENALLALNVALGQLQQYAGADKRATATAESFGGTSGTNYYTGIWPTDPAEDPDGDPLTPLTWLVSGNEARNADGTVTNALAVRPAAPGSSTVQLVGPKSVGTGNNAAFVSAPLQAIQTTGVPGVAAATAATVGRYAWWVGDQGVKAPVAVADNSASVTYAPFDSAELRSRIRQQIALGAGAANASDGSPVFEPRDANNSSLVTGDKVTATNQMALLKNTSNAVVGLTRLQQNFHAWSPNNYAVLADTVRGGLRKDLSIDPTLLGSAFAAWADYSVYTEDSSNLQTPAPVPPLGSDPLRRRVRMTPSTTFQGVTHSVSPVLSFFGISFSIRESSVNPPFMEVAARCVVGLWNPYSTALVPEPLKVEVTQLPTIQVEDNGGGSSLLSLQNAIAGGPLLFSLPIPTDGGDAEKSSWLPGRVYDWASPGNTAETDGANPMIAHHPDATPPDAAQGIVRQTTITHSVGPTTPPGSERTRHCHSLGVTTLRIRVLRASDDSELARFVSVPFQPFGNRAGTTPLAIDDRHVDFAFLFRLPETDELPTDEVDKWLSAAGRDPRNPSFPSRGFIAGAKGDDPAAYGGSTIVSFAVGDANRLLDRSGSSSSYDEDVPVFELPRAPLLSLGQLQHLALSGQRPFAIGNSWGTSAVLNGVNASELFDRFYFSGLVSGVTPTANSNGDFLLPNPLLRMLRKSDGTKVTAADLRGVGSTPDTTDADGNTIPGAPATAQSSKFLLQGGAFNLNSTSATAWAAVLRGVRFPAPQSFSYLDADFTTGTADDTATQTVQSGDAQFFRFPQSAQETYKADAGYAASTVPPPGPPDVTSAANTHLFRQGMRTLTGAQVSSLATKIADAVKARQAVSGPFRSLEEFLAPVSAGSPSLLEQAIADAGINTDSTGNPIEFSSQFLTQGDILTALAPVLFPRSDTFVIRTYGEAVNPVTNTTEGRAWCEAIVQRVPEYFNASADDAIVAPSALNDPSNLNQTYGRRFKVVSFRWLTRSDI